MNGSSTCLRTVETSEQQTCKTTSPAPPGNEQNEPPHTTNNRTLYRNTCDTNSDDTCIQFGIVKASTHDTVGQHIPSLVSGKSMFNGVRRKKVARFVLSRNSADKPFTIVSDAIIKYASQRNIGQDFRIPPPPPSIIALKMSIIALKMYRYSYKLIQTNYKIISHHDNANYYYFFILTII